MKRVVYCTSISWQLSKPILLDTGPGAESQHFGLYIPTCSTDLNKFYRDSHH